MRWARALPVLLLAVTLAGPSLAREREGRRSAPTAVTGEMRAWVRTTVMPWAPSRLPELERLRRLWQAMTRSEAERGLGLREEIGATVAAPEMFRLRRGDCVAFAHLFVALGREMGVPVYFVLFEEMEEQEGFEGVAARPDLRVATGHLAAGWGPRSAPWVFDFGGLSRSRRGVRWVPDSVAAAILWSNRGVDALLHHRAAEAMALLERAVRLAPGFPAVWVNLEVARRWSGDAEGAVGAWGRSPALELPLGVPSR